MRITIMILAAGIAFALFAGGVTIIQDMWTAAEVSLAGSPPGSQGEVGSNILSRFYPFLSYLFYILPMAPFILGIWYMLRR